MVKKDKTLKYIILIFMFVVSFFVFSNNDTKAITLVDTVANVNIELEEESDKYIIVSASSTESEINDWVIPNEYDSKPIVAIKDGIETSVLSELSNIVKGKISVGTNMETIGDYAFKNFSHVEEIVVSNGVISIGNDAFSGCDNLKILRISRYEISGDQYTSIKDGGNAGLSNNVKVVFLNSDIMNNYYNNASWDANLKNSFTYETLITLYKVYPNSNNLVSTVTTTSYFKSNVSEALFNDNDLKEEYKLEFLGFDFKGWYNSNVLINKDTIVRGNMDLYPKWELKKLENFNIGTYVYSETSGFTKYQDGNTVVNYGDFENGLNLKVSYNHDLNESIEGVSIVNSWYKQIVSYYLLVSEEETYNVRFASDSAKYKGKVVISYEGKDGNNNEYTYETTSELEIQITINKRNLTINVNDNSTEYGTYVGPKNINGAYYSIDSSTSLAKNESISEENVTVFDTFEDEYKNVNTYTGILKLSIDKITLGDMDTTSNYNITYNYGNLIINPKNIVINIASNKNIEYGDVESITLSEDYLIYGENENVIYTFTRENKNIKDAGEYDIIGVVCNNTNYNVSLDNTVVRKLVINPKKVQVLWNIPSNLVYDGSSKNVSAKYKDNENREHALNVTFIKENEEAEFKNAGEYTLKAVMSETNDNYTLDVDAEITRIIEKATTVISGAERQTKTYNGFNQYVNVTVNHYEAIIKQKYSQRLECKNVTVNTSPCVVMAYTDETENYKAASKYFNLYIEPYRLVVEPDVFEITYGNAISSSDLGMVVNGVNDEQVIVYFSTSMVSGFRDVGEYDIVGVSYTTSSNYTASMISDSGKNKLHITPMPLTVEFYYYENLVYDGNIKNIGIRVFGTEEDKETIGLEVNYGDKPIRNAGAYQIQVSLSNTNYEFTNASTLNFTIEKARYNIEGLKLENKKVAFNFKNHFINLQGNLPSGLKAEYTIDGNKGNGTAVPFKHTIKVTFIGDFENYVYVEPMVATLNVSITWIWVTLGSIILGFGLVAIALWWLIKNKKLVIIRRVSKRRIRKVIKKNKDLDTINEIIKDSVYNLYKGEEEIEQIEEPVKFVKNTVYVQNEDTGVSLSFVDKLYQSEYGTKQFYSEVKNELLSYNGIVSKIKRDYETFYLNNIPISKFDVSKGKLVVYFALDPSQYKKEEYNHKDASKEKTFAPVPLKLVVDSIVSLRHAKMFVRIIRKREGIKAVSNFIRTDYAQVYTAKESTFKLFKKSRVKKESEMED